jgi:hypothetical protein
MSFRRNLMIPRKWPIPAAGQMLTVTKPHPNGWNSAYFWRTDDGFRFVASWLVSDAWLIEQAFDLDTESWIATVGNTSDMSCGATPRLLPLDSVMLAQLDGWFAEIANRNKRKSYESAALRADLSSD